jgi:dimeric dUTPase (all-alpha-NTP-PPase superfamily)
MDKFEEMLRLQKEFQDTYKGRFTFTKFRVSIAMLLEAVEVMEAQDFGDGKNFKWWSKKPLPSREERIEEMVDVFHFFMLLMLEDEVTVTEFFEAYKKKLAENYARQESNKY